MPTSRAALALALVSACGAGSDPAGDGGQPGSDGGGSAIGDASVPYSDALDTATGCPGVYNPDQMLELSFELAGGDWNTILSDTTYAIMVSAQMSCNGEAPITVGLRRKRSGGLMKVGLKVDIDHVISNQNFHGLKKLSLENGVSSGDNTDSAGVGEYLAEYLAWRLMVRSGAVTGRAAFVRVRVNGGEVGVYVNVEQPDKRFLASRLGENGGWLYKKSGGVDDGFKTHELDGLDDPYDDWFCFWGSPNGCPAPSADVLAAELPARLDIGQLLRIGAVNAVLSNTDGIFFKENNYYWYDRAAGRVYLPWDLDTTMKADTSLFTGGGGGGTTAYSDVLFSHWRGDYEQILADLLAGPLAIEAVGEELERAAAVSGPGFATDPYVSGSAPGAADDLRAWWTQRLPAVAAELPP